MVWTSLSTRWGAMLAMGQASALTGLYFEGQKYFPTQAARGVRDDDAPLFAALRKQLQAFERGQAQQFELALAPSGTAFQQAVWRELLKIPAGHCISYGQLAHAIGAPKAVRAVGAAVGRNPISVVIPCHRVVGANGALTGYAGGVDRKQALLRFESESYGGLR